MTLEYRCSNCGTLLQTTNADPLDAEIERLRAALQYVLEDDGLLPRATSACRAVVRRALDRN